MFTYTCQCGKKATFVGKPIEVRCTCGRVDIAPIVVQVSRGLGDTIAKLTTAVGIKPCGGCKERQKLLNKLVPYSS